MRIRFLVRCACAVLSLSVLPVQAGVLNDPANGATCTDGQDVVITRSDFSLVLDGVCGVVTVRGSNGSLNVDEAKGFRIIGSGVTVLNQKTGTLTVEGSGNTLNMTEVGEAVVGGNDNMFLGTEYKRVHFRGKGNTVNTDNTPELVDEGSGNRVM